MNIYILGLICFVFGYLSHKIFASLIGLGRTMILCNHMILDCLYISRVMIEDVAFIRTIKTKEMRDLGVTDKTISHSQAIHDKTMNDWKENCIRKIIVAYPLIARGSLKFNDWNSAMKHLQENR
jgi:hypothetical protein